MNIYIITSTSPDTDVASANHFLTMAKGFIYNGVPTEQIVVNYSPTPANRKGSFENVPYLYLFSFRVIGTAMNKVIVRLFGTIFLIKYIKKLAEKKEHLVIILPSDNNRRIKRVSRFCVKNNITMILNRTEAPRKWDAQDPHYVKKIKKSYRDVRTMFVETPQLKEIYSSISDRDAQVYTVQTVRDCDDIEVAEKTQGIPYIAFCGVISNEQKDGLLTLIQAFAILTKTYNDLKFYIVGGSSKKSEYYIQQIKELIATNNLENRVILTGRVSRDDYVKYLKNALVLLNAKKKESFNSHGISSKVIEYLFSGNAIVMSDSDNLSDMLVNHEHIMIVEDDDPKEYSKAIDILLKDERFRIKIGNNGYNIAKQLFDYRTETKKIINLIKAIDEERDCNDM